MMKRYSDRLAALEALEAAQRPESPAFVCMHPRDYTALGDVTTPADVCQAIAEAYGLAGQKLYVGLCMCWGAESCRVCADQSVIDEGE